MKEEYIKQTCERLNALLPCNTQEKLDSVVAVLEAMFAEIPGSQIFYKDDILFATGGDTDRITYLLMCDERAAFVPPYDPEKYPGVFLTLKDTKV